MCKCRSGSIMSMKKTFLDSTTTPVKCSLATIITIGPGFNFQPGLCFTAVSQCLHQIWIPVAKSFNTKCMIVHLIHFKLPSNHDNQTQADICLLVNNHRYTYNWLELHAFTVTACLKTILLAR